MIYFISSDNRVVTGTTTKPFYGGTKRDGARQGFVSRRPFKILFVGGREQHTHNTVKGKLNAFEASPLRFKIQNTARGGRPNSVPLEGHHIDRDGLLASLS